MTGDGADATNPHSTPAVDRLGPRRLTAWILRETVRGLLRPRTGVLAVLAAGVPIILLLDVALLTDDVVVGGFGILGSSESALFVLVAFAAAGPASIVVADRRDGLVGLLRARGLTAQGYLVVRVAIAGGQAAGIALVAAVVAVGIFVVVAGPGAAVVSSGLTDVEGAMPYGRPLLTGVPAWGADLYGAVVAATAAGGLAGLGAVVGSMIPVPVLPSVVPLVALIIVQNLSRVAPVWAAAAGLDLPAGFASAPVDVAMPLFVWPALAFVSAGLIGRYQETAWMAR